MQVNPLFSSLSSSQQAAHIPTMEDIDVLLSPMDQQYQVGQHSDLQQGDGNCDHQVTCGCNAADCGCAGGQQGLLQGLHGTWPALQMWYCDSCARHAVLQKFLPSK